MQLLIEKGANVNTKDKYGKTVLLLSSGKTHENIELGREAAARASEAVIKLLINEILMVGQLSHGQL